ncbi:acyltransferase family protein [Brachybacterium fresconis]|uniref:Peptidoglycan/LPS O-acetylase OafA/YrhL n=1 Tax=Brachybacterium fresconis TaxID=173363 RepID=A0ABS4YJA1_9MICO|nr:acyltransferase family protein [Brachybacterium fresconis]MBP2408886.1 peptidoglycan/LPS O-acetylase OafA/YrhL [Brachybacterium fresconis]
MSPDVPGTAATHAGRFRPELHGLRGLAIGLVVLYHVWFDRVSGGVDVFLFISSFLLVGTFLRVIDRGGATRPLAYWARTFKRLLPPTAVVSLATLAGVWLILPPQRWMPALTDAAGSLLHVQNWVLIRRGVDYYAADAAGPSPFQHFWSLSIQGQVFLAWPLLIALAVVVARLLRRPVRPVLAVAFAAVLVASFAWSVHSTATQQQIAYFDTFTRLWEFAAGSLLGLLLPWWESRSAARRDRRYRRGRRRARTGAAVAPRVVAGWLGIAGLVSCGLLIDVQGAFPGWIAAWPLAAAALVLIVGTTGHRLSVDHLLATGPAKVLGDISYALYLVHWPLLTLYLAHTGKPRAGLLDGLVLILVSLAIAWLLTSLVDTPIRRWPWAGARARRSGLVAMATLVIGLAPVIGAQQYLLAGQRAAETQAVADNPGARVLETDYEPAPGADPSAAVIPTAALVGEDWVSGEEECSGQLAPRGSETEQLGALCRVVPGASADAPVIVSVGDSRMEQFSASLIELAQREGWTLVTLWKGGCTFAPDAEISPDCDAFSRAAADYLDRVDPDTVALATTTFGHDGAETLTPGMDTTLPTITGRGTTVLAVRALPRFEDDPAGCAAEHGADAASCEVPLPAPLTESRPDAELLSTVGEAAVPVDPVPLVCPNGTCSPVIGKVMVFLDGDHLTGTYAATMQDGVDAQLAAGGFTW